jgi:hypothetical protein
MLRIGIGNGWQVTGLIRRCEISCAGVFRAFRFVRWVVHAPLFPADALS